VILELLARAKTGEGVKSGPIGLAVILVLCVAAYFLFKSMSKHLKKVREEFPADDAPRAAADSPAAQPDPAQPGPGTRPEATPSTPAPPGDAPPAS
jgi:hypothetical protein